MKKIISLLSILLATVSYAHDDVNSDRKVFSEVVVTEGVSMLQGTGGNVGLLKGEDGLLIIDDGYKVNVGALEKVLDKEEGKPRFIINTHWHNDHTGGNEHLGGYVTIIAHDNVRKRLSTDQEIKFFGMKIQASEKPALPVITFDSSLSLHFNGQELNLSL
ncbi:MAG: MBL fold metallo-hydrolase, partial [Pseudomonadales bacterium]|nr:MBL fold metallo-hydrolase [Pseudomonadales bacterium]